MGISGAQAVRSGTGVRGTSIPMQGSSAPSGLCQAPGPTLPAALSSGLRGGPPTKPAREPGADARLPGELGAPVGGYVHAEEHPGGRAFAFRP